MGVHTVLIADDEKHIRNLLGMYFQDEGFDVQFACNGRETLELWSRANPDMILLDIMMPEVDGLEVCRQLRRDTQVPIIMLTAKNDDIDKVLALEMGADDYITKPFNPREVLARVRTVLRRAGNVPVPPESSAENIINFPQLEVYKDSYKAVVNQETVFLTSKEMEILWILTRNPGRVFTREQLLNQVWGYDFYGDSRTVDTHIKRLRQKIGNGSVPVWDISTVWGVGYKFEVKN